MSGGTQEMTPGSSHWPGHTAPGQRTDHKVFVHRERATMSITPCGYAVGTAIFTPTEIHQLQAGITDTINRLAHGFLTPYETSCPDAPFSERLERIAQRDRAYAVALIHGLFADAHHDPRIVALAQHPRLRDAVARLMAPDESAAPVTLTTELEKFP